ncbi:hypothetical protein D3C84_639970 [compost metagenome]
MHGLGFTAEAEHRRQRTEGLLAGHLHLQAQVGQHRRLEEAVAEGMPFAATEQARTFAQGILHMVFDLGHRALVDQRAQVDVDGEAIANLELADAFGEAADKGLIDAVLHQKAIDADAGLPGVAVLGDQRALDRAFEIGVVEDDEGGVAAEFQGDLLQGLGALGHEQLADRGGAGE